MRRAVGVLGHADRLERLQHPALELGTAQAEVLGPEGDVLADGAHEQLVVGVLEHDADAAADLEQVLLGHRQARDRDAAQAGHQDAVEVQHQRGLAGTVRTEQGDPLSLVDVEVDAVQRLVTVRVREGDALEVEDGNAHWGILPS